MSTEALVLLLAWLVVGASATVTLLYQFRKGVRQDQELLAQRGCYCELGRDGMHLKGCPLDFTS